MTDKPTQEAKKALIRAIVFDGYHTTRMKDADVAEHILAKLGNRFDTLLANTRSGDATELLREGQAVRYKAHGFDWYATVVDPDVEGWVEIKFRSDGSTAIVRPSHLEGEER